MSSASFRETFESLLTQYEQQHRGSQRKPWTKERILMVMNNIRQARAMTRGKTNMDYYWLSKYDIMVVADEEVLIFKRKSSQDPTVRILPKNEYFDVLDKVHRSCKHGGRDKMSFLIKPKFYIPKKAIEIFLSNCPTCEVKRNSKNKNSTKPD